MQWDLRPAKWDFFFKFHPRNQTHLDAAPREGVFRWTDRFDGRPDPPLLLGQYGRCDPYVPPIPTAILYLRWVFEPTARKGTLRRLGRSPFLAIDDPMGHGPKGAVWTKHTRTKRLGISGRSELSRQFPNFRVWSAGHWSLSQRFGAGFCEPNFGFSGHQFTTQFDQRWLDERKRSDPRTDDPDRTSLRWIWARVFDTDV
jgi:hypothetical protein